MNQKGEVKPMLKVSVIGVGNAGNQIAARAFRRGIKNVIAINSSEKDLNTVRDEINTLLIGDSKGAGKDRSNAKEFIKKGISSIIQEKHLDDSIVNQDVVFIVTSTGGGTGSGMGPVLHAVLSATFPKTHFIIVGILPSLNESLAAQQNSLEWLREMKQSNPTYMLYDNGNREDKGAIEMLTSINDEIVNDMLVVQGDYQKDTPYSSIDEKDSMKLYTTRGRLVIGQIKDFNEKDLELRTIEDRLISSIKVSAHSELEYDRVIKRQGLIINLNNNLYRTLDTNIPEVHNAFGEPIEGFEHLVIENAVPSFVATVMAGLSFPDDRISKTLQRIEKIQEALTEEKASILDSVNLDSIAGLRSEKKNEEAEAAPVDINELMKMY